MSENSKIESTTRWPIWALFPVGLLALLLTIQVFMVSVATNDPAFAVEEDYYRRAVEWDRHAAQLATNRQLAWDVAWAVAARSERIGQLEVRLENPNGRPIADASVELVAFPNARSSQRQTLKARELTPGHYATPFELTHPGLWEFRLTAQAGGQKFTSVKQLDVPRGALTSTQGQPL